MRSLDMPKYLLLGAMPIGFGLMGLSEAVPEVFATLKWISAAYICWLAWKVANLRLSPGSGESEQPPGFAAGLLVHPLNPKAWAMIVAGFLGTLAGRQVLVRMSDRGFKRALDIVLLLISARLIWQGTRALMG